MDDFDIDLLDDTDLLSLTDDDGRDYDLDGEDLLPLDALDDARLSDAWD